MKFEEFNDLSSKEMEQFKSVCNYLLSRTFVVKTNFIQDKGLVDNPDYFFLIRNRELVESYLDIIGWHLYHNDYHGYFYVSCENEANRYQFDLKSTAMLLALRLIYEEGQDDIGLEDDVITTVREVLNRIVIIHNILSTKPNMQDVRKVLNAFERYNIIRKIEGYYSKESCKFAILPTILTVVSGDKLEDMVANMKEAGDTDESTEESFID